MNKIRKQKAIDILRELANRASAQELVHIDSELFSGWHNDVDTALRNIFDQNHEHTEEFRKIAFVYNSQHPSIRQMDSAFMNGIARAKLLINACVTEIEDYWQDESESQSPQIQNGEPLGTKIFIVHGQNNEVKESVARFVGLIGLEPVILHEQANKGCTLIEKFENHAAESCFAIILLTPDDVGAACLHPDDSPTLHERARQNVVFEMGFFFGRLGRRRTVALYNPMVEKPSDIEGIVYISLETEDWRFSLAKELKAAGFEIDMNKII